MRSEATSARISSASRLNLARRFWNQVTTCALARPRLEASPSRSDGAKYFWKTNRRSSSSTCCAVNAVRDLRRLRPAEPGPSTPGAALPAGIGRELGQSPAGGNMAKAWKEKLGVGSGPRAGGKKSGRRSGDQEGGWVPYRTVQGRAEVEQGAQSANHHRGTRGAGRGSLEGQGSRGKEGWDKPEIWCEVWPPGAERWRPSEPEPRLSRPAG